MSRDQQILAEIKQRLFSVGDALRSYRVVLFGSRAHGTAKTRSDFDIGVLGPRSLAPETFYKVADLLDGIPTLYSIDWINLNEASESFRREAMKKVEVLYG